MPGMAANTCSLGNVSVALGDGRPGMEISRHHPERLQEAKKEQTWYAAIESQSFNLQTMLQMHAINGSSQEDSMGAVLE